MPATPTITDANVERSAETVSHTAGPWLADTECPTHYGAIRILAPSDTGPGYQVGWATSAFGYTLDGRSERNPRTLAAIAANARLIAAAPDLLAALTLIAEFGGKTLIGDGRYDEGAASAFEQAADIARAAIARATGAA